MSVPKSNLTMHHLIIGVWLNSNRISPANLSWHVCSHYGCVISGIGVGGSKTHAEVVYNMGRSQCWIGILEPLYHEDMYNKNFTKKNNTGRVCVFVDILLFF